MGWSEYILSHEWCIPSDFIFATVILPAMNAFTPPMHAFTPSMDACMYPPHAECSKQPLIPPPSIPPH